MAQTTLETIIANPARKAGSRKAKKKMAKRMTLKQKLHFGTARQRAAAKASMKRKRNPTAHRRRTKPRKNVAMGYRGSAGVRAAKKKKNSAHSARLHFFRPTRRKKKNPGELIAITLGNPARKRGKKTMAKAIVRRRKPQNPSRRRSTAGRRRKPQNPGTVRHRRRSTMRHSSRRGRQNPGQLGTVIQSGLAVIAGAVGTKLATQAVLGSSNTGVMGYAANAVATAIAAWGTHAVTKNKAIAQGILVGGVAQIILRVINDYTPYGQYLSLSGLGDYQVANFPTPSWYPNGLKSANPSNPWPQAQIAAPAAAVNSSGAGMSGYVPNWT